MSETRPLDNTPMHHELIIGGFGGQGVLKLGLTLAEAAMHEGRQVVWTCAYGPETRGGPSFCTVILSSDPIGAPVASAVNSAIIMDRPSLPKYQGRLSSGGTLILNSTLVNIQQARTDVNCYILPANVLAEEAGDPRSANMVMLGAFLHLFPLVAPATVLQALSEAVTARNSHLLPINERALALGAEHIIPFTPGSAQE